MNTPSTGFAVMTGKSTMARRRLPQAQLPEFSGNITSSLSQTGMLERPAWGCSAFFQTAGDLLEPGPDGFHGFKIRPCGRFHRFIIAFSHRFNRRRAVFIRILAQTPDLCPG